MIKEELWQAVLAQIQFNISSANFATWFQNTTILEKKSGKVIVSVPNNFSKEWLKNKYNKIILKILHSLDSEIKDVEYQVARIIDTSLPPPTPSLENDQLEFQEFKLDKETNLNPRYTFENFVVGSFNELAHAASWAITKNPGAVYNPLFVYGGVGLGKTHLLQAIGNEIAKRFLDKRVKYTSSEKFTSGLVASIKNHDIESYKSKFRNVNILIIDDIQFLAGKTKTQEEFFHTFNSLYEQNKQIVLSSDRPPKAIPAIEERLRSRFEGGMIADISLPDFETRMAILKMKLQERKSSLPEDILEYIASKIQNNIRELEGALNRLTAFQKINKKTPDLETSKSLLKNLLTSPNKIVTAQKIIKIVANFYDLKEKDLLTQSRKKEIVKPRQIAMHLLREELSSSFPFIGKKLGGKDHTTAIYACSKVTQELKKNENLTEEINLIRQRIYNNSF